MLKNNRVGKGKVVGFSRQSRLVALRARNLIDKKK